jgi:uncharacterized protein (TIGR00730 family)
MKTICVNCGSNLGAKPEYAKAAKDLGSYLGKRNITLIYGGASVGLMGEVANSVLKENGNVIGIIPKAFAGKVMQNNLTEIIIVETMHERKLKMFEMSEGFIALPGGMGTLEEILEILTWAQLGFHSKPCAFLNVCGYYSKLFDFLKYATKEEFIKPEHLNMITCSNEIEEIFLKFKEFKMPKVEKWIKAKKAKQSLQF